MKNQRLHQILGIVCGESAYFGDGKKNTRRNIITSSKKISVLKDILTNHQMSKTSVAKHKKQQITNCNGDDQKGESSETPPARDYRPMGSVIGTNFSVCPGAWLLDHTLFSRKIGDIHFSQRTRGGSDIILAVIGSVTRIRRGKRALLGYMG